MRLAEAVQRAETKLAELSGPTDPDRLVITRAELRDNGWLFYYCTSAFVESRSFLDVLGGALPILVGPDGTTTNVSDDDIRERAGALVHPGD